MRMMMVVMFTRAALILLAKQHEARWGILENLQRKSKQVSPQSSSGLYELRAKITERQPCWSRNIGVARTQHWGKNELRSYSFRGDVVLLV